MARTMSRRGFRLLLALTAVTVLGALAQDYRFGIQIARQRELAAQVDRELGSIDTAIADFRAAEAGYVATGQGPDFWMKRAGELANDIGAAIERQQAATASAAARRHYEAAATVLAELTVTDRRARAHVTSDQRFLASDAVFMDGLAASQRLAGEISAARDAEHAESEARLNQLGWFQFAGNGAGLAIGLVAALVFYRRAVASANALAEGAAAAANVPLSVPPPKGAVEEVPTAAAEVNLADVAELCVDLGRVLDGRDMPTLLERTARVLQAKGVVLWVIDTSGTFLRPLLSHGYPERVMLRLGVLQVDADNVTSLAFRSTQAQTISAGSVDTFGAIAVPLLTGTGCIGVLSAEIKRPRPNGETLSAAKLIAAQLAALAGPTGEASPEKAAQG
jgi:hypothetical protein